MNRFQQLSVVVPTLNEERIIVHTLEALQGLRELGAEVILVDGGSSDQTVTQSDPLVDRLLTVGCGRAHQLNHGWRAAGGRLIWFIHADTGLAGEPWQQLAPMLDDDTAWGRFDIRLESPRGAFRVIETAMNWRSRLTGIATGDQGIFVARSLLERVDGFPRIELMEDIALSRRLKRLARPRCLRQRLGTSTRRWEERGIVNTVLLMWYLRAAYFLGARPADLARRYRHAR
ncbi:MAG: TIGR04283 family arsenosugar biosynthesis glycosyltransferase [Xanthomonadales bacterium]|nr:TIGR04283 family arsenosugar biosynthesis glycosyltransferase [Xanthomonadales bacterium]